MRKRRSSKIRGLDKTARVTDRDGTRALVCFYLEGLTGLSHDEQLGTSRCSKTGFLAACPLDDVGPLLDSLSSSVNRDDNRPRTGML